MVIWARMRTKKVDIEAEILRRRDMRDAFTFTIDPADAKDFDDALSFTPLGDGLYQVGVHIADVSFFVEGESPIDIEAYRRGCTIYEVRGGYSGNRHEELQALLTKDEFAYVMDFIKSNNIQAFITAGNVSEVYGRWFKHNLSHYKNVNK
mgnify:CR=1 FL=1